MKILFFGTPRFAEMILQGLLDNNFDVVGVVCQPDKPSGRGNKMQSPKIVALAKSQNINVYQFDKIKDHIEEIKNIGYDLAVTASYGKILPKAFLDIAPCINVHPSLLPKYRGATPIQSALLNGDKQTGVCIMKTEVGMDDGDIFACEKVEISAEDDYTSLHDKLAKVGLKLLIETLHKLEAGIATRTPQNHDLATFVKPISKEQGLLDFSSDCKTLVNKVKAFCENPVAYFFLEEDRIKVYKAKPANMGKCANVGEVIADKKRFLIQAQDDVFEILECQSAGGKRLSANVFLNGYHFKSRQVKQCF